MKGGTLGVRIFTSFAAALGAIFVVCALWGESRIREFHREEVERRLATAAELLEPRARAALSGGVGGSALAEETRAIRLGGPLRVTWIAADGTMVGDNMASLPLENHGSRPEILAALHRGDGTDSRTSASTGTSTLYLARRLDGPRGLLGFVRVAEPLERAEEEVASLRAALLLGGAVALLMALGISALMARRVARPLEEMERTAARIAAGDLEVRASEGGPEEMARLAGSLNRMADQVRDRMEAERRLRQDLESVLAGIVEGVVAVDGRERILFMNGAAARILGLPAPLSAGEYPWEAIRFRDLGDSIRSVLRGVPVERHDADAPGRPGTTLEVAAGPLGAGEGAVAVMRDVTEIRRLEKIRMDFVANVSHELRTPLAAVSGALETLEDAGLAEEERGRFLDIAGRNSERLQTLVADLLDLSAIESEGTALPIEPIPLDQPARIAAASLADMAARREVGLSLEPAPPGLVVAGNPRRLEQAFLNLVENALKYTPAGGSVKVRFLDLGAEAADEVEDTGIGIPPGSLPRIFERFYRVDPSRSRAMGGTGLGLAIVKHILRAHRGRVEVRSVEGAGSTFRMVLPRIAP